MAVVTQARLGILRLNAGRLNAVVASVPSSPSPAHGSQAGPYTLTWVSVGGTSFDVHFGTSPTPPHYATTSTPSASLPPLTDGVTYYWQVIAQGSLGAPTPGPVWSFIARKPTAATLVSPANGATNQTAPLTFTWTAVTNTTPVLYDLELGTPGLGTIASGIQGTSFTVPTLASDVTYRWRIVARNNAGATPSAIWTFATRVITGFLATIGGVAAEQRMRLGSLTIRDILTDTPNTASFSVDGTAPTVGQEVRMGLGTLNAADCLFAGRIDTVTLTYESISPNRVWQVTCQDYTTGLNRRKVRRRYSQQSATAIAQDLRTRYAPAAFTGNAIAANLPIVEGGIDFTEEDLTECFTRLAQRIGGYWYVDYERDIHLFTNEVTAAPTPITAAARVLLNDPAITHATDVTQIRTRVYVEGGGSEARAPIVPGATSIPVTDASWYPGTGGMVVSGPQRITYTGKGTAGGPTAPTVAEAGAGGMNGTYSWKYAHIVSGNESTLSAASAPLTIIPIAPPSIAITAVPRPAANYLVPPPYAAQNTVVWQNGRLAAGEYRYYTTYRNTYGETTPSPDGTTIVGFGVPSNVQLLGLPAPPAGATQRAIYRSAVNGNQASARLLLTQDAALGSYFDDLPDDERFTTIPLPTANTTGQNAITPGAVRWLYTFGTAAGETLGRPITALTIADGQDGVTLTVPTSPSVRCTSRRIYRTKRGTTSPYYLEAVLNNNTTTSYFSNLPDASLSATTYPGTDTSGPAGGATVAGITTGPAGTTARRLYRTDAGGAVYKLVVVLNDNTTTTYVDTKADSALGATASGEAVLELIGIPASGTGAVALDIAAGDDINLFIQVDDVPAQQSLAALEGPPSDGIVEHYIQDRRLGAAQATATGKADLALFARPIATVVYATRDPKTRSGKSVTIDLPTFGIVGTFTIQSVDIDQVDLAPGLYPRFRATASSVRWSFEDVLRRLQLEP